MSSCRVFQIVVCTQGEEGGDKLSNPTLPLVNNKGGDWQRQLLPIDRYQILHQRSCFGSVLLGHLAMCNTYTWVKMLQIYQEMLNLPGRFAHTALLAALYQTAALQSLLAQF